MTREQIESLAELEKKATAGEWWNDATLVMIPDQPGGNVCHKRMIDMLDDADMDETGDAAVVDAKLVAALRNAAPDLFRLALRGLAAEDAIDDVLGEARRDIKSLPMDSVAFGCAEGRIEAAQTIRAAAAAAVRKAGETT